MKESSQGHNRGESIGISYSQRDCTRSAFPPDISDCQHLTDAEIVALFEAVIVFILCQNPRPSQYRYSSRLCWSLQGHKPLKTQESSFLGIVSMAAFGSGGLYGYTRIQQNLSEMFRLSKLPDSWIHRLREQDEALIDWTFGKATYLRFEIMLRIRQRESSVSQMWSKWIDVGDDVWVGVMFELMLESQPAKIDQDRADRFRGGH